MLLVPRLHFIYDKSEVWIHMNPQWYRMALLDLDSVQRSWQKCNFFPTVYQLNFSNRDRKYYPYDKNDIGTFTSAIAAIYRTIITLIYPLKRDREKKLTFWKWRESPDLDLGHTYAGPKRCLENHRNSTWSHDNLLLLSPHVHLNDLRVLVLRLHKAVVQPQQALNGIKSQWQWCCKSN